MRGGLGMNYTADIQKPERHFLPADFIITELEWPGAIFQRSFGPQN